MASTAGHQEGTLVFICGAIAPTDSMLSGDVRTVWRADALRTAALHPTHLPRATLDPFTCLYEKRGIKVGIEKKIRISYNIKTPSTHLDGMTTVKEYCSG